MLKTRGCNDISFHLNKCVSLCSFLFRLDGVVVLCLNSNLLYSILIWPHATECTWAPMCNCTTYGRRFFSLLMNISRNSRSFQLQRYGNFWWSSSHIWKKTTNRSLYSFNTLILNYKNKNYTKFSLKRNQNWIFKEVISKNQIIRARI